MRAWLDASVSTSRPPAGVQTDAAAYGLLGLRAEADAGALTLGARAHVGAGARTQDGRWLFAEGTARWTRAAGPVVGLVDAGAFFLRYDQPYDYHARAVQLQPGLAAGSARVRVTLTGDFARGDWRSRYPDTTAPLPLPDAVVESDGALRVDGLRARVNSRVGPLDLELAGALREATNGTLDGRYTAGHLAASLPVGPGAVFATLQLQDAPDDVEAGAELGAQVALGRTSLVALLSRPVSDPLYGTRSGVGLSLGASVRLHATPRARGVAVVGRAADGRREVTLRVRRPDAPAVEVAGSFNGWVAVPMRRSGDDWVLTLHLPPGSYTFAFRLPDGTWFVPEDAAGIVDDGFGQRNATLVVPPL